MSEHTGGAYIPQARYRASTGPDRHTHCRPDMPTCGLHPLPTSGFEITHFWTGQCHYDATGSAIKRSVHLRPSQAVPGKMDSGSDPERCSECSDVDDDGESSDADDDDEGSVSDASSSGGSDPSASGSTDTGSGGDDSNEATAEQFSEPSLSSECEEVGEVEAEHKDHCTLGAINCPRCRWIRHRVQWRKKLTFRIHGERGSWVEGVCRC